MNYMKSEQMQQVRNYRELNLEPAKVFINIGTNDINERSDGEYWRDHLLRNYEKILKQIKEKNTDIISSM